MVLAASLGLIAAAQAQVHVDGYYRNNGTYVAPYMRTAPDGNVFNNYSTQGNINPYTGQMGTVNPYAAPNTMGQPMPSGRLGSPRYDRLGD